MESWVLIWIVNAILALVLAWAAYDHFWLKREPRIAQLFRSVWRKRKERKIRREANKQQRKQRRKEWILKRISNDDKRVGRYIEVYWWHILYRPLICSVAGLMVGLLIVLAGLVINLIAFLLGSSAYIPILTLWIPVSLLMGAMFAVHLAQAEEPANNEDGTPKYRVPNNRAAILTFWGRPTPFYLLAGDYTWVGRRLGLGRSEEVVKPGTDSNGFVNLGDIPFPVWNSADQKDNIILQNVAKNGADVFGTATLVIDLRDPLEWIKNENPALDIGERTRSAFRTSMSFFNDTDNAIVKTVLGKLMSGKTIITSFIRKQVGRYTTGDVIRDVADQALLTDWDDDEEAKKPEGERVSLEQAEDKFRELVENRANPEMLETITRARKLGGVEILVETLSVEDSIQEVIEAVGARLKRATIANIILSEPVRERANEAAGEGYQRDSQIATARAVQAAMAEMAKGVDLTQPGALIKFLVAAAQDDKITDNIHITHVTGDDNTLTKGLIAAANQVGGNK